LIASSILTSCNAATRALTLPSSTAMLAASKTFLTEASSTGLPAL